MNELEHETLERQHRMRPEIANLLRVIYPALIDDQTVEVYENVKGVSSNLYFISHTSEEHRDPELNSMSNEHEAAYLIALCNYLVLQGYAPSRITILTPYTGQVGKLCSLSVRLAGASTSSSRISAPLYPRTPRRAIEIGYIIIIIIIIIHLYTSWITDIYQTAECINHRFYLLKTEYVI